MSYGINGKSTMQAAYIMAQKYGKEYDDRLEEMKRANEMLEDLAGLQKALDDWRANGSNVDYDGNGKTVQQEAIAKLEALIAKYPQYKDDFAQGLGYAKKYTPGVATDECNKQLDAMLKTVDGVKDANGKHDQLLTLELNDALQNYNRVALQASEQMAAHNQVMQSIIGNMRG
ncbi:MAG: hypothetical protein HYZ29_07045 [Myxococcales bacterium]|nr:hypothetical protein [Myxococcales bacterium]